MAFREPTAKSPLDGVPRYATFAGTHIGRRRETNQDAFVAADDLGLYVVADGIGGAPAGDVASREAVDTVHAMVKRAIDTVPWLHPPLVHDDARKAIRLLESAVQGASYFVHSIGALDKSKRGLGTTLSAVLLAGSYAVMAHMGDSRIYRVRGAKPEILTQDHSELIVEPGNDGRVRKRELLTKSVGDHAYADVDLGIVSLCPGDRLLLCSDGLYRYMKPDDLVLASILGGKAAVDRLIELANDRGGADNITAILIEIE